jgi:hypothetical protein
MEEERKRRMHRTEKVNVLQSRRLRLCVILAAATVGVLAVGQQAAFAAAGSRTSKTCESRKSPLTGTALYTVCLTTYDWWTGTSVQGQVRGESCSYVPMGFACRANTYGQYWNSSIGAWEDWLNYAVVYISPVVGLPISFQDCVYLRVDTKPDGSPPTLQHFHVQTSIGTHC